VRARARNFSIDFGVLTQVKTALSRSRRKKRKSRAAGFLTMAGLTVLIAGFVARHEIPTLIRQAAHSPAARANADTGAPDSLGGDVERLPPRADSPVYASGGNGDAAQQKMGSRGTAEARDQVKKNPSGEHITAAERRQLDKLIGEKSR